jgi:hypothetical protein
MSRKKTKDMRARSLSKSSNSDPDEDEAKDMVDSLPGGNEEE